MSETPRPLEICLGEGGKERDGKKSAKQAERLSQHRGTRAEHLLIRAFPQETENPSLKRLMPESDIMHTQSLKNCNQFWNIPEMLLLIILHVNDLGLQVLKCLTRIFVV